jgi:hypothetical protein
MITAPLRAVTLPGDEMAGRKDGNSGSDETRSRPKYRDNDDMRDPLEGDSRQGVNPESRNEARGDARQTPGDNVRGTDANPTGPEGNDRTKGRPAPDSFDADLREDSQRNR